MARGLLARTDSWRSNHGQSRHTLVVFPPSNSRFAIRFIHVLLPLSSPVRENSWTHDRKGLLRRESAAAAAEGGAQRGTGEGARGEDSDSLQLICNLKNLKDSCSGGERGRERKRERKGEGGGGRETSARGD